MEDVGLIVDIVLALGRGGDFGGLIAQRPAWPALIGHSPSRGSCAGPNTPGLWWPTRGLGAAAGESRRRAAGCSASASSFPSAK